MIYIEYDGSGHDLGVRTGKNTNEELIQKDRYREIHMKQLCWKCIRIISSKDKLPLKDDLLYLILKATQYLNNNHSWIYINIDEKCILGNKLNEKFNLYLKHISKKDI